MNDTTIVLLAGGRNDLFDIGEYGGSAVRTVGPSELRSLSRTRDLVIVGEPPEDEVGFGLAAVAAVTARPQAVTLLNLATHHRRRYELGPYAVRVLPAAFGQLAASGSAVAMQYALASALRMLPPASFPQRSSQLQSLLYIRPHVGRGAAAGGGITHSNEVIRALLALGIDVNPVTTDRWITQSTKLDGASHDWRYLSVSRVAKAIPASLSFGGDLALLRASVTSARRADVIYQRHARFSLVGALLARLTRTPLFLEYNGSELYIGTHWQPTPLRRLLAACEEASLRAAARIIVVSEPSRLELIERGFDDQRIVVNPNGVDVDRFARGGGAEARRDLGLAPADFVVGFVGTFGLWHGAPVLARAFVRLARIEPRARLLLVGTGPQLGEVRTILREANVDDRLRMTGERLWKDVPGLLDACDILASPHVQMPGNVTFFGSPTKLFEYMASGKPIVASRLEQIAEVLEHERTALLVEAGDEVALANALARLAEDPALGRRLGAASRRAASERHAWRANAQRVLAEYAGLSVLP